MRPEDAADRDRILTDVSIYWVTRTALVRPPSTNGATTRPRWRPDRSAVPTGVAVFTTDISIRPFADKFYNVVHWSEFRRGGHFAALEAPDLLTADVRDFFRALRTHRRLPARHGQQRLADRGPALDRGMRGRGRGQVEILPPMTGRIRPAAPASATPSAPVSHREQPGQHNSRAVFGLLGAGGRFCPFGMASGEFHAGHARSGRGARDQRAAGRRGQRRGAG